MKSIKAFSKLFLIVLFNMLLKSTLIFAQTPNPPVWVIPSGNVSTSNYIGTNGFGGVPMQISANNQSPMYFFTGNNPTPRINIAVDGKVGIGVASNPSATLDVNGNFIVQSGGLPLFYVNSNGSLTSSLRSGGTFTFDATTTLNPRLELTNSGGNGWIHLAIAGGPNDYGPGTKLNDVLISNRSNSLKSDFYVVNQSYQASIKFVTKDINNCCSEGKQRMEIKFDGKVVIGNNEVNPATNLANGNNDFRADGTSPATFPDGYKLYVAKGILTPKVKVAVVGSGNWADFVFEPDYKLTSLEDVNNFIKENKHLPGVPSANEVIKDGLDVAKMDALLLQKIEELTLYLIELKGENKKLSDKINSLIK